MSSKSQISYSTTKKGKESGSQHKEMNKEGRTHVKRLLAQSLAICLMKIKQENGNDTANEVLKILSDDLFDLNEFKKQVNSMEKCNSVTSELIRKRT